MNDDWLWDRSGEADPEVARLESLLVRYRYSDAQVRTAPALPTWVTAGLGAAAAVLFAFVLGLAMEPSGGYSVDGIDGVARACAGDVLEVGSRSARVVIGDIGEVELDAGSRVRVVDAEQGVHALFIERGGLHARIVAEPRLFQVGSPAGMTIDLGCEYRLSVVDGGDTELAVLTGQVAFEYGEREVYVPAGASCRSSLAAGPTPPIFEDADPEVRTAIERFAQCEAGTAELEALLDLCGHDEGLPLFALLGDPRQSRAVRERIYAWMRGAFDVPGPEDASMEALLAGDPDAREAWLDELRSVWARW